MKAQCPHCKAVYKIPDVYRDKQINCPKCKEAFTARKYEGANRDPSLIYLKTTTFSDKLLRFAFRFAKGISVIIVTLCFIAVIGCVITLLATQPNLKTVPHELSPLTFSEYRREVERRNAQQVNQSTSQENSSRSFQRLSPEESIEREMGKQINELCSKYNLNRQVLVRWLVEIKYEYQEAFLSKLGIFLTEAKQYRASGGQKNATLDFTSIAKYYHWQFEQAIQEFEQEVDSVIAQNRREIVKIAMKRKLLLMIVGSSIGCLLVFLLLPLLIQIEHNTRVLIIEK